LPLEFVVIGFTDRPDLRALPNTRVLGAYAEADLPDLLARERCHLALFASVWPETYSYTLSQAFFAGLYPVAFDIGAIAARIRKAGWGLVLPFDLVHQADEVNDALLACERPQPPTHWPPVVAGERLYPSIVRDYYGLNARLAGHGEPQASVPRSSLPSGL
jgi:hypothetical protein